MINIKQAYEYDDVDLEQNFAGDIQSRKTLDTTSEWVQGRTISLPILSAPMRAVTESEMAIAMYRAGGAGVIHRFMPIEDQARQINEVYRAGAHPIGSIGIAGFPLEDAKQLVDAGAEAICIDVAHGGLKLVSEVITYLKALHPDVKVIAGNVMTGRLASRLANAGADAIRVGIGPGAVCTTRLNTGVGGGQLTAVAECAEAVDIPIIADGGIKHYGDVVKAFAAGASAVMIGTMFAGCPEAPTVLDEEGNRVHYGSSYPREGKVVKVQEKPSVAEIMDEIDAALRSGMSYLGAKTIPQMSQNATFRLRYR